MVICLLVLVVVKVVCMVILVLLKFMLLYIIWFIGWLLVRLCRVVLMVVSWLGVFLNGKLVVNGLYIEWFMCSVRLVWVC